MMKKVMGRRSVVLGIGHAALGGLAAALPRGVLAGQAPAAPMKICLSMIYPAGDGLTFAADAFRDRHLALLKRIYGTSLERVELRVAVPPPPPPPPVEGQPAPPAPIPPPILAAVNMWIGNVSEFIKRIQASGKEVAADMATITKSAPIVQFDVLEGQVGDAPAAVLGGTTVLTHYFFAKEGGTWESAYFGKDYLPKLLAAYGPTAIQRVEAWRGEQGQGGGKPLLAGSILVYLKDLVAYDAAVGSEADKALGIEALTHTSINPVRLVMAVHATS